MSDSVKIDIDLTNSKFSIECSESAVASVFERLEDFLPLLSEYCFTRSDSVDDEAEEEEGEVESQAEGSPENRDRRKNPARQPRQPTMIDLGLSKENIRDFKEFFNSKAPKSKGDLVLVAIYWLEKKFNRKGANADDVYTALKTVDARVNFVIPPALSRLKGEGRLILLDGKYQLTPKGEDFVEHELRPVAQDATK